MDVTYSPIILMIDNQNVNKYAHHKHDILHSVVLTPIYSYFVRIFAARVLSRESSALPSGAN